MSIFKATNRQAILVIQDLPVDAAKLITQGAAPGTVSIRLNRTPEQAVVSKVEECPISGTVATGTPCEARYICCTRVRIIPQAGTSLNRSGLFQFATGY